MHHYFVVNPSAGKGESLELIPRITEACLRAGVDYTIYETKSKDDGIRYVREISSVDEDIRIYSVGGDGTLNYVLNGIVNFERCELACIPCGTGNDFIKCFTDDPGVFLDIGRMIVSQAQELNYIQINKARCMNICNVGLDSKAAYYMQGYKKMPFMRGSLPYIFGVLKSLFEKLGYNLKITSADGIIEGCYILAAIGNGQYYGGAFRALPLADTGDGLMDVCLVDKVTRMGVLRLIGKYKAGKHIDSKVFRNILLYKKTDALTIECDREMCVCVDGEISSSSRLDISVGKENVRFVVPKV